MAKKIYIKDDSFDPIFSQMNRSFYARTRILPIFLISLGIFVLITQVAMPLVVFKTSDRPNTVIDNATVVGIAAGFKDFEFRELESNKTSKLEDKTKEVNIPEFFYITIPKLNIEYAKVESNAKTLDPIHALGHYPGTSLPGEKGNAFIFGHSVLPWFFNPKNYKTIFSTLDKLDTGDEIYIEFNHNLYRYVVESKNELDPKDVNPLAQIKPAYLNESTMVLMTCYPAGTKLKRLLVNAVMVN